MNSVKQCFPNFEPQLIEDIEAHALIKQFKAGETIIKTGQYIQYTLLVLQGKIKIFREDQDGNEFLLYYLQPGQACAISMICASKMETSQIMAKVVENAEVVMIPLQQMEQWMGHFKSWYEFVVNTYKNRFEEILLVLDQVAFRSMDERLKFYLKRQVEQLGQTHLNISHQEVANELNSSREVISRLLKKMEQRGMVKLHRNHIEVLVA
jgi:CRP/FNR family transcriptional regulator